MTRTGKIYCEISVGELLDKITILQIKQQQIKQPEKQNIVTGQLEDLNRVYRENVEPDEKVAALTNELREINLKLWNIEDDIRECERRGAFGDGFIQLARSVYFTNDERSRVKNEINKAARCSLVEVKSYAENPEKSELP